MNYYDCTDKNDLILRDYLAAERTHLANERTLLAYLRSALILLVTAVTILKLFDGDLLLRWCALILGSLSILVGAFGVYRFTKTRQKLVSFNKNKGDAA